MYLEIDAALQVFIAAGLASAIWAWSGNSAPQTAAAERVSCFNEELIKEIKDAITAKKGLQDLAEFYKLLGNPVRLIPSFNPGPHQALRCRHDHNFNWSGVVDDAQSLFMGGLMNLNRSKETLHPSDKSVGAAWLLLSLAISLETTGALGLRFSQGFTLPVPTGIALAAFTLALYLVSQVMKTLPVSVAYPVWAGGGTAGVALLGILVLGETLNATKILGIILVVAGVILVNKTSEKKTGC